MGITGLLPFIEKASRKVNIDEFSGCTVAIDSYCWLHKGAFACAERLARGEETDVHIRYCLKYVTMLLKKNIKPILVFDGRHLPAKAQTELKRRESRDTSKKRAAELLSLGKKEEARTFMRRSIDITHTMALNLIKECRKRNVDCIVAPYEADAQLAYLNIKNIAHLVITEDSDLILFGCTKVLFKMDLDGTGTLVETAKLPLIMKCPIERYTFDKFRQMCIMSGCDYLPSLPGIGLAKAQQFINATQDPNIASALRKMPSFFNKSLTVTDKYREDFLKAEATFKHQYVYDPIHRQMLRLTEPDDEDIETALCVNAGELLDAKTAFQLALGNIDPFTLKVMDDWHPDFRSSGSENLKTDSWKDQGAANHPSIWSKEYEKYLDDPCPWKKKPKKQEAIIQAPKTRAVKKVVNMFAKYVPETQDQDLSLSIETLSSMYCFEPQSKKQKVQSDDVTDEQAPYFESVNNALTDTEISKELSQTQKETKETSPILKNKERSFTKCLRNGNLGFLKRLSKFPRTVLDDDNIIESKFFSPVSNEQEEKDVSNTSVVIEESPERISKNPFRVKSVSECNKSIDKDSGLSEIDQVLTEPEYTETIDATDALESSQKENSLSPVKERSPILESKSKNPFRQRLENSIQLLSEDSVIDNTYPMEKLLTPVDSQELFGLSQSSNNKTYNKTHKLPSSQPLKTSANGYKKPTCKVPGLKRTVSLHSNQPTLLGKFGFQKKPVLKR